MRLDHALGKIGVTIVRQHSPSKTSATLMLRVPQKALPVWAAAVEEFLLAAAANPAVDRWTVDVSRVYFLDQESKTVRYLWRVVFSGNCGAGAEALGLAIIRSLSGTVEVTSQPLVGRVQYEGIKGGHDPGTAQRLVAAHFTAGGTS